MARRGLIVAFALAGLLAASGIGYVRFMRPVPVPVLDAARGTLTERVVGPGSVQPRVPITLSARTTATVREVLADVGDRVRRGDAMVLLDDRDLAARRAVIDGQQAALARNVEAAQATVARAQADLDLARSRRRRDAELLRAGFVSPAVLDASDAAVQAATATLDNARATLAARAGDAQALAQEARYADTMLSYTRVAAPTDGVVIARLAEAGATVVPGNALLRLVDPSMLWVAMRVDEAVAGRVQIGQAATIRLRTGETMTGKVARIAYESDAATRELEVDVAFDSPPARFAIDQEAEVAVVVGEAPGIVLPLAALVRDGDGRSGVLVVVDGRTRLQLVSAGASDGERVLVTRGLAVGEQVVARAEGVKAGARVRPLPAESVSWTSR